MTQHKLYRPSLVGAWVGAWLCLLTLNFCAFTTFAHPPESAVVPSSTQEGTARYLANEGVLVELDDTKILFDAFFSNSYGNYSLVPEAKVAALHAGTAPYDGIDALFVSHAHGDHFSPEPTLAYLRAQPGVRLFGPVEAIAALKALLPTDDTLATRLTAFTLNPNDTAVTLQVDDIDIEVVAIPHAGGERMAGVRNLVFRVTLNDQLTVVHLGDAAPLVPVFAAQQPHWDKRETHHAFPPYWFFEGADGKRILQKHIRARHSTGVHVPAAARESSTEWRQRLGADLFIEPDEQRTLPITNSFEPTKEYTEETTEELTQ